MPSRKLVEQGISKREDERLLPDRDLPVVVTIAELKLATTWDEIEEAWATGQMVVVSPMMLVTTTVPIADDPKEDTAFATAAVLLAAGQFVTDAAQEITVRS